MPHFRMDSGIKNHFRFLKSLRFALIILFLAVAALPGTAAYNAIIKAYERRVVSMRTADIQNQCTIISNQLNNYGYLSDTSSEVINASLTQLMNSYNGRVIIVNKDFKVVKDTYSLDEGKYLVSENVYKCMQGSSSNLYDKNNRYIEVATPVMDSEGKQTAGAMLATVSTDIIAETVKLMRTKGRMILGGMFILIFILSLCVANLIVKPLGRITKFIEDSAEGYNETKLHENRFLETEKLSDAFNKTRERLKQLDDSREDFVSNVSHELRTPMTSMKLLSDSLLSMEDAPVELYREFMGDIAREIDRENNIISDLLSIVKMDRKAPDLNIKPVEINGILELILKRLKPLAEEKNVELVLESFRAVTAEVDEVKLTLAFSNLVENAIKYNKENGSVHVSLDADYLYFYVKVADTGIGIPEEDRTKIFQRFYRVDKSHSREMGGTGLGLAIVKSAVMMHRGTIKVDSKEGEGSLFTVRIPLTYVV